MVEKTGHLTMEERRSNQLIECSTAGAWLSAWTNEWICTYLIYLEDQKDSRLKTVKAVTGQLGTYDAVVCKSRGVCLKAATAARAPGELGVHFCGLLGAKLRGS